MLIERFFIWPLTILGYSSMCVAFFHWVTDTWSGAASLGMLLSVVLVAPATAGYAGYLWRKNLLQGWRRWEALVCAAFPVLVLLLASAVIMVGRVN